MILKIKVGSKIRFKESPFMFGFDMDTVVTVSSIKDSKTFGFTKDDKQGIEFTGWNKWVGEIVEY